MVSCITIELTNDELILQSNTINIQNSQKGILKFKNCSSARKWFLIQPLI